jgi:hypothetical protein
MKLSDCKSLDISKILRKYLLNIWENEGSQFSIIYDDCNDSDGYRELHHLSQEDYTKLLNELRVIHKREGTLTVMRLENCEVIEGLA